MRGTFAGAVSGRRRPQPRLPSGQPTYYGNKLAR